MKKKIVIIDNDELFRAGIASLIQSFDGFQVPFHAGSEAFFAEMKKQKKSSYPDLILLCPPVPETKGIPFCEDVTRTFKDIPVMLFSNYYSKYFVIKAIEFGVRGYFTKGISPYALEDILTELTLEKDFPDIKMESIIRETLISRDIPNITFNEGEEDVLRLMCEQKSNAEISNELEISIRTVESRKRNMMLKTRSKNMIGVILLYMKSRAFHNKH